MGIRSAFFVFSYAGVTPQTHDSVVREVHAFAGNDWSILQIGEDAMITRSRATAMTKFLRAKSKPDVCFFVDRDIGFELGAAKGLIEKAHETQAIVGGLYSRRELGQGWAGNLAADAVVTIGKDELVPARHLATGFIAFPRSAVEAIADRLVVRGPVGDGIAEDDAALKARPELALHECRGNYIDFFSPITVRTAEAPGWQAMGEDLSFSERATFCGVKQYVWTAPRLTHHGSFGFEVEHGIVDAGPGAVRKP